MSSRREAPEPWAAAMIERGLTDRGRPSMRQLAQRAGVSVETVRRMLYGTAVPEVETVDAVARALGVSASLVSSWVGINRPTSQAWIPVAEAALLSPKVQSALDQLIRAMTESEAGSDAATMTTDDDPVEVIENTSEAIAVEAKPVTQRNPKRAVRHTSGP